MVKEGSVASKEKTGRILVYEMYYEFEEPAEKLAGHRCLH